MIRAVPLIIRKEMYSWTLEADLAVPALKLA